MTTLLTHNSAVHHARFVRWPAIDLNWPLAMLHLVLLLGCTLAWLTGFGQDPSLFDLGLPLPQGALVTWHWALGGLWLLLLPTLWWPHVQQWARRRVSRAYALRHALQGGLYLLMLAMPLSGVLRLALDAADLAELHRLLSWAMLLLVLLHAAESFWRLGLAALWQRMYRSLSQRQRLGQILACLMLLLLAASLWPLAPEWFAPELRVPLVQAAQAPQVDGVADEPVWLQAPAQTVATTLDSLTIPVEVRAVQDGHKAYFHLRWPDRSPSFAHLPLEKRADGWHVLGKGYMRADERLFYEDKLAIMLANGPRLGGAASVLFGATPLAGKPGAPHGQGYHATSGALLDLWHWKATRNHIGGGLDDSYIGPPTVAAVGERRYTAGYQSDPLIRGGVVDNAQWPRPGALQPLRLPRDPQLLAQFQQAGPEVVWGMRWAETRPYDHALDHYPVGTRMPSVLWQGYNEGDRGDVSAQGRWQQGYWSLELSRALHTGSPFDVQLQSGLYLWLAVFDHSQTRHSQHWRPLRLQFAEVAHAS